MSSKSSSHGEVQNHMEMAIFSEVVLNKPENHNVKFWLCMVFYMKVKSYHLSIHFGKADMGSVIPHACSLLHAQVFRICDPLFLLQKLHMLWFICCRKPLVRVECTNRLWMPIVAIFTVQTWKALPLKPCTYCPLQILWIILLLYMMKVVMKPCSRP